jgi:hypothetical protein
MNGYNAFQNSQCAAPSQQPPSSSSSSQPRTSQGIDNCCFVDRQCATDQEWADGHHAFQNNQCGAPGHLLRIVDPAKLSVEQADHKRRTWRLEGSASFIAQVNASLDLLRARAPHWYVYTVFGHDWILEVPDGAIVSSPTEVKVHLLYPDNEGYLRDTCAYVGYLVHVAAHNYQQQKYLASGAGLWLALLEDEREAMTVQIDAMEAIYPGHRSLPGFRHTLANIENPEYQWWH